jgi:hypothetical protein
MGDRRLVRRQDAGEGFPMKWNCESKLMVGWFAAWAVVYVLIAQWLGTRGAKVCR